jgi:apolipoprotein N-acyltransferase
MRAIESQRFLVRAANDGISAVIDPRGEFVARAADFEAVVLRATITPRSGIPPFLRFGNQPFLIFVMIGVLAALWAGRRRLTAT